MLLFRDSRLSHCPNYRTNNTEPTPYVFIYANMRVYSIHTNEQSWCCNALVVIELARFRIAKTKRVRRFLLICTHFFTLLSPVCPVYRLGERTVIYSTLLLPFFATLPCWAGTIHTWKQTDCCPFRMLRIPPSIHLCSATK